MLEGQVAASPRWVYPFGPGLADLDRPGKELLGGKGASLADMSRAGLPVPPGFTITTECCRSFFQSGERWPAGLDEQTRFHLQALEEASARRFGRGRNPLLVSVRSGAAASMPGMMDTLLNCGLHPGLADDLGNPPEFWPVYTQFILMFARTVAGLPAQAFSVAGADPHHATRQSAEACLGVYCEKTGRPFPTDPWTLLCECISAVFRSWNTDRAVVYRQRNDIRGILGTAVNVQAMFPSEISGILFTQDPNDLAAQRMVLEASYGLGEAVVSGDVTPDRFLVPRDDFRSFQAFLGNKNHRVAALGGASSRDASEASLAPEQVQEICAIGLRIEEHFGGPMDIEWGWAEGRFALLQCRPIRGLEIARDVEAGRAAEIERLKKLSGGRRRIWVTHNLGETLRAPTPLTWDIVRRFMSGDGGFGRFYQDLGYRPSPLVAKEGFLELIGARIYADPDRVAQLFWGDGPLRYDLDAVLTNSTLLDQAPTKFEPEKADGRFFLQLPGMLRSMLRAWRVSKRLRGTIGEHFEKVALPPYLDDVRQKRAEDLAKLDTPQVCAELRARCVRMLDEFGKESLKPGFFGALAFTDMRALLVQLMGVAEGGRLACTLTMGLEGDTTVAQNQLLYRVSRGEATMERFLDAYGHRTVGEMELAEPRYRENPRQLDATLEAMRHGERSPEQIHREHAKRRAEVEKELPALLAQWGGGSFRERIEDSLRQTQKLLAYRESGKHYLMMGYELIRLAILELVRRWDLGREVFFLTLSELERFESRREQLLETAAQRQVRWKSLQRLDMPEVIDSRELDRLGLPRNYESAAEFNGDAVAAGVATGTARIVFDPREARELGANYILVCPSTDPGWTALFVNARGLVVEKGGVLSHGAIVARDFGIPAVVCPGATKRIKDGSKLRLDGNRGVIHLEPAEERGTSQGSRFSDGFPTERI
jgi:rifampicin phosphotransferase